MGLLDDAIRDHLELKRRHGADPSEVAQQEQEALGPAGGDEHEPEAEREPVPAAEAARAYDQEVDDEYEPQPGDRVEETTDEEEPLYDEDLTGEEEDDDDELPADVEQPAAEEPRPRQDDQLTLAGEEERDDDVLEETPQFLQETPEHERLWFEQKPPRDFDF
jgi:hypothetical protein